MVRCMLCRGTDIRPLYTVERYGYAFPIARCHSCSLVFQHPMPKKVKALYGKNYFEGKGFDETVNYAKESKRGKREKLPKDIGKERFNTLRLQYLEKVSPGKRLLDVGCAMGFFLGTAKRLGWDCHGVELSTHAAAQAKKSIGKERIHRGTLEDVPFPKKSFDCITLFDVIEHVEDPLAVMKRCHALLRPGGIIVIETANVDSVVARIRKEKWGYFLYGHLVYFSRKTLRRALMQSGFASVQMIMGDEVDVWRKSMLKNTLLGKVRALVMNSARKIGIGDLSVGGMVAIGRKP